MLVSKTVFSESDRGRAIKVVATASSGDTIHTGPPDDKLHDEVWLWAFNSDTSDRLLTLQFGGTTDPDDNLEMNIPSQDGLVIVTPGLPLQGDGTAKIIRAFASLTNVIMIYGYINKISQG